MHNYANVIYVIPSKVAKVVPVRRNMMVMQWLCECCPVHVQSKPPSLDQPLKPHHTALQHWFNLLLAMKNVIMTTYKIKRISHCSHRVAADIWTVINYYFRNFYH